MPSLKHTHTYIRWKKRGNPPIMWWRCADVECTHIIEQSQIQGKESLCNNCGGVLLLDWKMFQRARPLCLMCQDSKEGREFRERKAKSETLMEGLLKIPERLETDTLVFEEVDDEKEFKL